MFKKITKSLSYDYTEFERPQSTASRLPLAPRPAGCPEVTQQCVQYPSLLSPQTATIEQGQYQSNKIIIENK